MSDQPSEAMAGTDADEDRSDPHAAPPDFWWRRESRYFVEVLAVAGFAVAQPVLATFGRSPETFVGAGASSGTVVLFGVLVVVGPAMTVWSVAALSGLGGRRVRRIVQALAVGLFVTLFAQWAVQSLVAGAGATAVAVGLGALVALAYPRLAALRLYLTFAAVAPAAFLVLFLGFSSVTPLVFPPDPVDTDAAAGSDRDSVVVLLLDELPTASLLSAHDEIDAELYPNFARLADDSSFYRNNTTVATHTDAAVPALLTGRYPLAPKASRRDYSENLFSLLGDTHELNVHETVTALCTAEGCDRPIERQAIKPLAQRALKVWTGLLQGASQKAAAGGGPALEELERTRFAQFDRFLGSLEREGDRPQLDFAHVLLPHQPWEMLPSGHQYLSGDPYLSTLNGLFTSQTGAKLARQRHLLQLQYTDVLLGRVLDRLAELDRYDDSYVIVMADHGVSFKQDENARGRVLTHDTVPPVLWAPLFVKEPRQTTGVRSDENTQTIDVVPTIADAMDIDIPWEVDGRSLLSDPPLPAEDKRYLPSPLETEKGPDGEAVLRAGTEAIVPVDGVDGYRRMLALPPASDVPGSDPLALYRLAPYTELTNTAVEDLATGPPMEFELRLDDPGRWNDVDLTAASLPVSVRGELDTDVNDDVRIVVAVNGVVGGWSALEIDWGDDWQTSFEVLLPESLLRLGRNEIEVFAMTGEPGNEVLHPIDGNG